MFCFARLCEFLRRLHSFVGVFIGPFILVAAFTGALYGLSFSLENFFYRDVLYVSYIGEMKSLSMQVKAAQDLVGSEGELLAVRPAPEKTDTTRVLFSAKNLGNSEYRTIFVNPYTLEIKADMVTYGTTGALPLRRTIDLLHRDLLLGDYGRWYSELGASWLWLTGVTGLVLYLRRRTKKSANKFQKVVRFHSQLGVWCLVAILMLSVTGLTWSEYAGEKISKIRSSMQWQTPSLKREIVKQDSREQKINLETFDKVILVARNNGIDSNKIEIKPSFKSNQAWTVTEVDRSYPTQVDAVSIDPEALTVTDKLEFEKFPLMAKLTRWGVDIHMGSLFGLANQMILTIMALGISGLGLTGYWMWLKKRAWRREVRHVSLYKELIRQPILNKVFLSAVILFISAFLPLFCIGLVVFSAIEYFYYA